MQYKMTDTTQDLQKLIEPFLYLSGSPRKVLPGTDQNDLLNIIDQAITTALDAQQKEFEEIYGTLILKGTPVSLAELQMALYEHRTK